MFIRDTCRADPPTAACLLTSPLDLCVFNLIVVSRSLFKGTSEVLQYYGPLGMNVFEVSCMVEAGGPHIDTSQRNMRVLYKYP